MLDLLNRALLRLCNPTFGISKPRKSTAASPSSTQTVVAQNPTLFHEVKPLEAPHCTPQASNTEPLSTRSCLSELPPEIMGEIFALACHATTYKFHGDKKRHLRTTPLILGHVCADWRAIVWATPSIWSHVSLVLSIERYDTQMLLLREWLTRSGVCALYISMLFEHEYDWNGRSPPTELIEMLLETAHRWRLIYFVLPEAWYHVLESIHSTLPLLVKASTQPLWSDCGLPSSRRKCFTLLRSAPALRDVHLNGYYLTDVNVPWAQLTSFTMQHVYLDECLYALVRTTKITFCRVYTILANDVGRVIEDLPAKLELPIAELIVYSATWVDNARLFGNLTLPALKVLELSLMKGPSEVGDMPLLLLNLGCNLQTLKLTEFDCYKEELNLINSLQQIPTLKSLEIGLNTGSSFPCDFFPKLLRLHPEGSAKEPSSIETFLAMLEEFKFSGTVFNNVSLDASGPFEQNLLQALRVRVTESCLRSFELTTTSTVHDYPLDFEVKKEFRMLRSKGLRLNIVLSDVSWLA